MHEDAAARGGTDGKSADAILSVQLLQFPLLLPPLRASLPLGTLVRLGEQLFDGDDRDRLRGRDDVEVSWHLAPSPLLPGRPIDGSGVTPDGGPAGVPALAGRAAGGRGARPTDVLEGGGLRARPPLLALEIADGVPHLVAFAERLDVELLELVKVEIEEDSAVDIMDDETFDDGVVDAARVRPIHDLLGRPRTDGFPGIEAVPGWSTEGGLDRNVLVPWSGQRGHGLVGEGRLGAGRWWLLGEQGRHLQGVVEGEVCRDV
ncbi:hypothetical protein Tdes44962_MAKER10149 [Teratosphaeria destructans]|uniref:Uncharacterized protein n=1 Tax=Teratosphaeria destructans TaxID=418781 RepID=A0A9W7SP86_9PEZI|nr:hypothetical protein Tdes44962_MAKER10149 [Teratosphaeria destructans]